MSPGLKTARLELRELQLTDADFYLELLNDAGWLRHIGDRGVRTIAEARTALEAGPLTQYRRTGFGLWLILRRQDRQPLGLCGLIQRDWLPATDLGYALLETHQGQGYAREAATACLNYAFEELKLPTLAAITTSDNPASIRLLLALGFDYVRQIQRPPHQRFLLYTTEASRQGRC